MSPVASRRAEFVRMWSNGYAAGQFLIPQNYGNEFPNVEHLLLDASIFVVRQSRDETVHSGGVEAGENLF